MFCKKDDVSLYFPDPYNTNVQWYNNGTPIAGANSQTYQVTEDGSYTVTGSPAVCPDFEVCQCVAVNIAFDNFTAVITQNADTLLANRNGKEFQWHVNGNPIPGATQSYYLPSRKGLYTVTVTDKYNCTSRSKPVYFAPTKNLIVISPNPASSFITVQFNTDHASQVFITDTYGNQRLQAAVTRNNQRIAVGNLKPGTYMLRVADKQGNIITSGKFMKHE